MEFINNDGGRLSAGFKGSAGDCVTRAIAIAGNLEYRYVYEQMSKLNESTSVTKRRKHSAAGKKSARNGVWTNREPFKRWMREHGFTWTPTMTIGSGCRVHLVSEELPTGRIIVSLSRHFAAVIDGVLHDTYDCSRDGKRCVYGYWSKD